MNLQAPDGPVQVRRLCADDAPAYHALRLTALSECPSAFGADAETERGLPLEAIVGRVAPRHPHQGGCVGAWIGDTLVGMACVIREPGRKEHHKARLVSVYVATAHRRRGISRRLLLDAIALARTLQGIRRLNLTVTATNLGALALYRQCGFEIYGREPQALWADEVFHDEYLMSLALEQRP